MFGSSAATPYADFNQALTPVTSYVQGSDAGSYTARAGDTLESIAANLWGDSSLWYLLASANGLSGPGAPGAGRTLAIPANVMASGHSAKTFKPYDPARAIGDLSPTNPKPAKKGGCGMMGAILMIAIAVAVTALTAGAAVAALGPATGVISGLTALGAGTTTLSAAAVVGIGAAAGALGSIASQGFGIAIGQQSKFNWKGVGLAAIAGGIGAGMGPSGFFGKLGAFGGVGNGIVAGALRGAVSSALTQGIGVATGLQKKFDFAGVAGAALGGGISGAIGNRFSALGSFGGNLASNAVGGLANAAARSLIDGTDFGDNLIAALPDVIGSTLGNWITDSLISAGPASPVEKSGQKADPEGDVVVTANQGGHAANPATAPASDILPKAMRDDPVLRALARTVQHSNLAQLRERYGDARENVNDRIKARDDISTSLNTLRIRLTNTTDTRQLARIQRQIASLEGDLTRANRLLARDTLRESTAAQQFETAQGHLTALQNYFVGKAVNVRGGTYTIRGPNPTGGYRSKDEAATDAIALAWSVVRATGRRIEYAGYIYEDSPNVFSYNQTMRIGRGTEARTIEMALATGGSVSAIFPAQNSSRREVGIFHIHPRNSQLDEVANAYFGPGDLYATQRVSRDEGRSLPHYLGASDGAIRVLSDPLALPQAPVYNADRPATYTSPPVSSYRVVQPTGYFKING